MNAVDESSGLYKAHSDQSKKLHQTKHQTKDRQAHDNTLCCFTDCAVLPMKLKLVWQLHRRRKCDAEY
jgi:hypothetical protein